MRSTVVPSFLAVCLTIAFAAGCSSTSSGSSDTGGGGDTATNDTGGSDATADTGGGDAASDTSDAAADVGADTGSGSDAGCSGVELTVLNYLAWCSVSVNGETASSAASQTVCVPADSPISLVATALNGFQLGLWHHTDGDGGSGDAGTVANEESTATVTTGASGAACVWVCCPFTSGSGCPNTDQCQ